MYGEENIISAVIHVDETTPHLCDFVPLTSENLSAKSVIGDEKEKCAGRKRNFLKQCKEGASLNLHVGAGEHNLTA